MMMGISCGFTLEFSSLLFNHKENPFNHRSCGLCKPFLKIHWPPIHGYTDKTHVFACRMQSRSALWESGRRSGSPSWITHHATRLLSAERPASCSVSNRGSSRAFGRWDPRELEKSLSAAVPHEALGYEPEPHHSARAPSAQRAERFPSWKVSLWIALLTQALFVIVPFTTRGLSTITASSVPPIGHTPHPTKREGGGRKSCLRTSPASVCLCSAVDVLFSELPQGCCMCLICYLFSAGSVMGIKSDWCTSLSASSPLSAVSETVSDTLTSPLDHH